MISVDVPDDQKQVTPGHVPCLLIQIRKGSVHTFGITPPAKLPLIKSNNGKGIHTLLVAIIFA